MSSFTTPLIASAQPDGRNWKLYKKFTYRIGSRYSRHMVNVKAGFVTDFASAPSFLWSWIPSWGKYGKAAVLHDYLYHSHQFSRLMSDHIFFEAMLVGGTPQWKARIMYSAVRLFGWLAWKRRSSNEHRRDATGNP